MKRIILLLHICWSFLFCNTTHSAEVTIIGVAHASRSIGLHTKGFIDCLKDHASLQLLLSSWSDVSDLPEYIKSIVVKRGIKTIDSPIVIFTDEFTKENWALYKSFSYTGLRILFAWIDQTEVPRGRVHRLNNHFDMILVPDEFCRDVYKSAGVKTPIFVLPESIDLEPFLSVVPKKNKGTPFVFGSSAAFWPRKNHELLLEAFAQEFGNNPDVTLKIHGRWGYEYKIIKQKLDNLEVNNVHLIAKTFTRKQYADFITSLDCYVLVSKGEGFSITPREALAAGIPCIISNNTAHKTICKTGFVQPVPSDIKIFCPEGGYQFNCQISDVRKALREVYERYEMHCKKAQEGRLWAQQYLPKNLSSLYKAFVKPKSIMLGDKNELMPEALITNDLALYKKYKTIFPK